MLLTGCYCYYCCYLWCCCYFFSHAHCILVYQWSSVAGLAVHVSLFCSFCAIFFIATFKSPLLLELPVLYWRSCFAPHSHEEVQLSNACVFDWQIFLLCFELLLHEMNVSALTLAPAVSVWLHNSDSKWFSSNWVQRYLPNEQIYSGGGCAWKREMEWKICVRSLLNGKSNVSIIYDFFKKFAWKLCIYFRVLAFELCES